MLTSTQASHPGPTVVGTPGTIPLVVPFRLAFWLLVYKILGLAILRFTLQQPENLAPNTQKHITASPGSPLFQAHTPPWPGTAGSHICRPAPPVFQPSVPLILNLALPRPCSPKPPTLSSGCGFCQEHHPPVCGSRNSLGAARPA